ncbi:PREDICTED: esterase E4-like [Nicrophorus vespilloides]|uniref:Carboxylic ester hydrolase n=1 Tax=Nicrophorus vespilloides TaxID=110193 RepID=A0ABM1MIV2_NICVS|nr:PREDICTED: esterase E4-like [Nicrophorus vespilloides]
MGFIKTLSPVFFGVVLWYIFLSNDEILVELDDGKLSGGQFSDRLGGKFYAFQGIPYAKPPIGNLRFKAPQPADKWEGILNGSQEIKKCIQNELGKKFGEEDCLYLNVYTPEIPKVGAILKPVMVYIHGGAFLEGSASMIRLGPDYLITEDVVIVVINYRIGALGFMNLENSDISANNGMKDQVMALKWVQKNIEKFGGDPNSVTIFGESAGAASVDLLMLSPLSKGLFQRAIAQSGSALADWVFGTKNNALPVAKYLGIQSTDPMKIANELRKVSYEDLFRAQQNTDWNIKISKLWNGGLIIEGNGPDSFLPEHPQKILQSGQFNKVPLIIGFTNKEGILIQIMQHFTNTHYSVRRTDDIPYSGSKGDENLIKNLETALNEEYFKEKIPKELTEDAIVMWSDIWFKGHIVNSAQLHSKHHDVYLYEFSLDSKMNFFKMLTEATAKYTGASHVDDLGYLFKHNLSSDVEENSIEDTLIRKMVKLWTNFAKYGVPTRQEDDVLKGVIWKPTKSDQINFLNITNEMFKFGTYNYKRIQILNHLFNYRST